MGFERDSALALIVKEPKIRNPFNMTPHVRVELSYLFGRLPHVDGPIMKIPRLKTLWK